MDRQTVDILRAMNAAFYATQHASFSQSRQTSWPGWGQCVDIVRTTLGSVDGIRILDVACGNMRFEQFLAQGALELPYEVTAADSCDELACDAPSTMYLHADVIEALLADSSLIEIVGGVPYDVAVSFGFMHHIPSRELRERFLAQLVSCVIPGGLVIVSLWQFMGNEHLAKKAYADTQKALEGRSRLDLEQGDYLLGWNEQPDVWRYCHHFDDDEVMALVQAVSSETVLIDRFSADGRDGRLNCYLVLKRL